MHMILPDTQAWIGHLSGLCRQPTGWVWSKTLDVTAATAWHVNLLRPIPNHQLHYNQSLHPAIGNGGCGCPKSSYLFLGVMATSWWHKTTSPSGPLQCQYLTRRLNKLWKFWETTSSQWLAPRRSSIQIRAVTLKVKFLQISARPSRSLHISLALHPTTPWEMACWKE